MRPDIAKVIYEPSRRCDYDDDVTCGNTTYRRRDGRPRRQHELQHTRKSYTHSDRYHGDETGLVDAEDCDKGWSDLDMPTAPLQEPTHRFGRARRLRFAALAGWCRKQAGRKWDDSYAELKAAMPGESKVERRILRWVSVYLRPANEVVIMDGRAYDGYRRRRSDFGAFTDADLVPADKLYVDPRDGIVKWGAGHPWRGRGAGGLRGARVRRLEPLDHRQASRWILPGGGELFWNPGERCWMHTYTWQRPLRPEWDGYLSKYVSRSETVSRTVKVGKKQLRDLGLRAVRD